MLLMQCKICLVCCSIYICFYLYFSACWQTRRVQFNGIVIFFLFIWITGIWKWHWLEQKKKTEHDFSSRRMFLGSNIVVLKNERNIECVFIVNNDTDDEQIITMLWHNIFFIDIFVKISFYKIDKKI
jgi:hypothetical protein